MATGCGDLVLRGRCRATGHLLDSGPHVRAAASVSFLGAGRELPIFALQARVVSGLRQTSMQLLVTGQLLGAGVQLLWVSSRPATCCHCSIYSRWYPGCFCIGVTCLVLQLFPWGRSLPWEDRRGDVRMWQLPRSWLLCDASRSAD